MSTQPIDINAPRTFRPGRFYRADLTDCAVTADGLPLDPGHDYLNHAARFAWGEAGAGTRQLAFAILHDHLGDPSLAIELHERFADEVLARLPRHVGFALAPGYVDGWVRGDALLPGGGRAEAPAPTACLGMRPADFIIPGYLRRWYLFRGRPKSKWNVYLHNILAPDRGLDLHDHPAWSITVVLRGWYEEQFDNERGTWTMRRSNRAGSIRFRRAEEPHRIREVSAGGCWTLWIRGGHRRTWGFWVGDQWVPWHEHDHRREGRRYD